MKERKIIEIENNPTLEGMAKVVPDVVFSTPVEGLDLKMQIIMPWHKEGELPKKCPTIVFVQGSAWKFPNVYTEIPQLSWFAREFGYVVATVTHRSCLDGHAFPGFLQDVKTAIRFLRAHADEYGVDVDRIGIWGTSSGGNTALLVGGTPDDPRYRTSEWAEFSDKVKCVVECFGPSDINHLLGRFPYNPDADKPGTWYHNLFGGRMADRRDVMAEMSPVNHVDGNYPPSLLLHGDADPVVPYSEAEMMLDKLLENDIEASLIRVRGAIHEGNFWSNQLLQMVADFLKSHL